VWTRVGEVSREEVANRGTVRWTLNLGMSHRLQPVFGCGSPHHFNAEFANPNLDTDPLFHFNADPDPTFLFNADSDPATHHCSILIR
jgi:hypothetical protein